MTGGCPKRRLHGFNRESLRSGLVDFFIFWCIGFKGGFKLRVWQYHMFFLKFRIIMDEVVIIIISNYNGPKSDGSLVIRVGWSKR